MHTVNEFPFRKRHLQEQSMVPALRWFFVNLIFSPEMAIAAVALLVAWWCS